MKRKTSILLISAGCVLLFAATAAAEIKRTHVEFSPYAGAFVADQKLGFTERVSPLVGARLGVALSSRVFFDAQGSWTRYELPSTTSQDVRDIGFASGGFSIDLTGHPRVRPFLTFGGGFAEDMTTDAAGSISDPYGAVGGGIKIAGSSGLGVRLEAQQIMLGHDDGSGNGNELLQNTAVSARLVLPFAREYGDGDSDGVTDNDDLCAATPSGALVDTQGCPTDSDTDGVWDGLDQCKNTPTGAVVDGQGCPTDADSDGVFDGIDVCMSTPAGAVVDDRGCPVDSDSDGVVDGLDNCPDTPVGARVDESGCQISETEYELLDTGRLRLQGVNFHSGKAELDPSSYPVLDEAGEILSRWPQLRVEIAGHTDSAGRAESNRLLSERRAQAVTDYLLWRFPQISSAQLRVRGYGEELPMASNDTADGRARNRRVELTVINREELRQIRDAQQ
ncbi:MAG: OmpA family protein [Candidatus Latescibacterota bacterium]|nr:MAG: OmpA family protein [Candidatus Latescibacterota bacterium]